MIGDTAIGKVATTLIKPFLHDDNFNSIGKVHKLKSLLHAVCGENDINIHPSHNRALVEQSQSSGIEIHLHNFPNSNHCICHDLVSAVRFVESMTEKSNKGG